MATFASQVFQNEYLPEGGTDVNAIVRMSVGDTGHAGTQGAAGEIIILDSSGSMGERSMMVAKNAAMVALDHIIDGTYFAVVSGTHKAYLAYPIVSSGEGMVQMNPRTRAEAKNAIGRLVSGGGTAIGAWLRLTGALFDSVNETLVQRHALLLTDGADEHETPAQLDAAIAMNRGKFQCDARGVGTYWIVGQLRKISQALMGTLDIVPSPSQLAQEFTAIMRTSMSRGVADAKLRVWVPQGADLLFVRQVSPDLVDLTNRATNVNPLTVEFDTGAWGNEERDYHVGVRLAAKAVGQEQLAARVQLIVDGQVRTQGLVKAVWSVDDALTASINAEVAHYTGQTELAKAIQDGLRARAAGDISTATSRLGRAVQLASSTGNVEAEKRLSKVVDVVDTATGTVRMKSHVNKADEMALDTASTKTTRTRKGGE